MKSAQIRREPGYGSKAMQQAGEPSVEEILESIKKVIARDGTPMTLRHEPDMAEPVEPAQADEAEEILDLEAVSARAAAEALGEDDPEEAQPYGDLDHDADAEAEMHEPVTGPASGFEDLPLTGASTVTSMRENFAALAMMAQPGRPPKIVRSGETSLEGLTRDLLRPMLAEWLDANLPGMVEEMVKAEIARIAGKGR